MFSQEIQFEAFTFPPLLFLVCGRQTSKEKTFFAVFFCLCSNEKLL
jgi:hypothetical protein